MFNLFKKENYDNDPLAKKQWINHFFALEITKPSKISHEQFLEQLEHINDEILSHIAIHSFRTTEIGKSVGISATKSTALPSEYHRVLKLNHLDDNKYFIIIRFPDLTKNDKFGGSFTRANPLPVNRNHLFSPQQTKQCLQMFLEFEKTLSMITRLNPHELATLIVGKDNEIIIHDFDGIQYVSYNLSERAQLYAKYPKLDKELFGMEFKKFIRWIYDKEADSEEMFRNVARTKKILEKYKIEI